MLLQSAAMSLDVVETLQLLIRAPSVNPMGRDITGPTIGEPRMTDLLESICTQQGWSCIRQPVHAGRENLVALLPGNPLPEDGGELLLWDVHQDTVPVDGMTVDPFGGEVRDGRVYGRGACDVKGAMAAMLCAMSRVSGNATQRRPTIMLVCTVNEECGFTGAKALANAWSESGTGVQDKVSALRSRIEETEVELEKVKAFLKGGGKAKAKPDKRLWQRRPDAAIVAEPTEFKVVVAHQGAVRWRCHTVGRAAHTSRPDAGINAIYAMAGIVRAVEQFQTQLRDSGPLHPLCGRPSVCVSTIHGGVGINTVPERVTIEIDRRLGPDEEPNAAYDELVRYIASQADVGECRIEHDAPFMSSSGLSDRRNRQLGEQVAQLVRDAGRQSELVGEPYGTDASILSAADVPTIVVGPGSIAQAHTCDEYIEISELEFGAEVFYRIAMGGLGGG